MESLRFRGGGDLGGEGVENMLVLRRQLAAGHRERHAAEVPDDVGFVGLLRRLEPRCRHHGTPRLASEQRGRAKPERGAHLAEHLRQRARTGERPGQRGERLGLRPGPARLEPAAADPIDEHRHHARRHGEDDQGEQVLAFVDRELVERGREVPVRQQRAADNCGRSRKDAADEGDDHGQDQVEQQHTGQAERVAGVGEQQRQHGQANQG